jgi:hypothetical protein
MKLVMLDFEYREGPPGRLEPVCLVAQDYETERAWKVWLEGSAPSRALRQIC